MRFAVFLLVPPEASNGILVEGGRDERNELCAWSQSSISFQFKFVSLVVLRTE